MRLLRRPIAFLLLAWYLPACSTYRTTDLTPQEAIAGQKAVRVTLADAEGTQLTVQDPWIRADTLWGVGCRWSPIEGRDYCDDSVAVPLSSVREVQTRKFNILLTSGAVFGTLSVLAGGLVIICLASGCLED